MAEHSLPFLRRIVRQALFEWVQSAYRIPVDRIFKEVSARERLGPRERDAGGQALYEFVRYWNVYLPKDFDPQNSSHLHRFDEALTKVLSNSAYGERNHLSAKPRAEEDVTAHLKKLHTLPEFLFREMNSSAEGLAQWHRYLHTSLRRAPLFFRLNESLSLDEDRSAREQLRQLGAQESSLVERSFRFYQPVSLAGSDLLQRGWGEIQDEHSQLAAHILNPQPGESILDLCAGGGGKTLHLADKLGNAGNLFAYDADARRLAALLPRMKKRPWTNIKILSELPRSQKFDSILIDAPCSGLGTLRRGPDRLFSFSEKESERLRSIQSNLVLSAKKMLAPHGKILYITCTPRPQENLQLLAGIFRNEGWSSLDLHHVLRNSPAIADSLLPKSRLTSAATITQAYLPSKTSIGPQSYLSLGPDDGSPVDAQASDTLRGDAFFFALVQ